VETFNLYFSEGVINCEFYSWILEFFDTLISKTNAKNPGKPIWEGTNRIRSSFVPN